MNWTKKIVKSTLNAINFPLKDKKKMTTAIDIASHPLIEAFSLSNSVT